MNRAGMIAGVLLLLGSTAQVNAEVYQWRDAEGKVHFSDKKPASTDVEDISGSLEHTNVEQSGEQRKRLNRLFVKETAEERQLKEAQARNGQTAQAQQEKLCREAQHRLKILRGRVVFPDGKGGYVSTSEAERERRAGEMQQQVTRLCK